MRRLRSLVLLFSALCVSSAWAQNAVPRARLGRLANSHYQTLTSRATVSTANANVQVADSRVYDLGYYPGGSWSEPRDVNDFGVVVGFGDVPGGYTHPLGVPVFGPDAGQWFDLGTLGGERTDAEVMSMGIADTGMIVGHSAIPPDGSVVHAFTWTVESGMSDLGTLGGKYNFSLAFAVNKLGTLIVGWSSSQFLGTDSLPVVWTPQWPWRMDDDSFPWQIQKLPRFTADNTWYASAVNDLGQIVGNATTPAGISIAVLWTPVKEGKWTISRLPVPKGFPHAWASGINDKGEIVGGVAASDWSVWFPALWEPVDSAKTEYTAIRLTSTTGWKQGWAEANGINNHGDIVGDSYDANGYDQAALWSTRDPGFVELLGFPGTWGFAEKVNDFGLATGAYFSDTVVENTVAVQFR